MACMGLALVMDLRIRCPCDRALRCLLMACITHSQFDSAVSQSDNGAVRLDAPRGFEPRLTESESVVLPLDDRAMPAPRR